VSALLNLAEGRTCESSSVLCIMANGAGQGNKAAIIQDSLPMLCEDIKCSVMGAKVHIFNI